MSAATSYHLPDTMSTWPWPRRIHPCAEEAVAASRDWLRTLHAFNEESQRAFDKYNVGESSLLPLTLKDGADGDN